MKYVGGSTPGSETLYVDAMDMTGWGSFGSLTATTTVPGPTVNVHGASVLENASITASSLISLSNPSGDAITWYFWDVGAGGSHLLLNNPGGGTVEPSQQWITVSNLSHLHYVGGSSPANDTPYITGYDATTGTWLTNTLWSLTESTLVPSAPRLAADIAIAKNEITDQFNDSINVWNHLNDNPSLVKQIATDIASTLNGHFAIDSSGFLYSTVAALANYHHQQCVDLVFAVDSNLSAPTGNWHPGALVDINGANGFVNSGIAAGTPIATFTGNSYNNNHAAIFLGAGTENGAAGFFVLDQYNTTGTIGQHPLNCLNYEPAEVHFIGLAALDSHASEYHAIT